VGKIDGGTSAEIVVQNHYFVTGRDRARVTELRQRANTCRISLGLPAGTILQRVSGPDSTPWLVWQQPFASLDAWIVDLDRLAASAEFVTIREMQGAALSHFDRVAYRRIG
jgi:hypothetical protein